jgi:hypothetical protein
MAGGGCVIFRKRDDAIRQLNHQRTIKVRQMPHRTAGSDLGATIRGSFHPRHVAIETR